MPMLALISYGLFVAAIAGLMRFVTLRGSDDRSAAAAAMIAARET